MILVSNPSIIPAMTSALLLVTLAAFTTAASSEGLLEDAASVKDVSGIIKLAQEGISPPAVPGQGLITSPCGGSRICVFDASGALLSWAQQFEVAAPARRNFWGNRTNPFRENRTFTGGYPAIKERQEAYNSRLGGRTWERIPLGRSRLDSALDRLLEKSGGRIPADGALNLRTLAIPYLESRRAVNRLWGRYQHDCLRDAKGDRRVAAACLGEIETRRSLVAEGNSPFPDQIYSVRAGRIFAAWDASLLIRDTVEELFVLTRLQEEELDGSIRGLGNWPAAIGVDHLEPDRLPVGFLSRLDLAAEKAKLAILDAALFEDLPP